MALKAVTVLGTPLVTEGRTAAGAITPGMLLEVASISTVDVHGNATDSQSGTFALERDENGSDFDVAYASGDTVKEGHFPKGARVNALIASGQNIIAGAWMESAGDGTLKVVATDAATDDTQRQGVVGQAMNTVNNSAGPGNLRLIVQVV